MKTILIDDEKHTRSLLRKMVDWRALGIDVVLEATDGETAAAIIEQEKPEIIITDMKMPIKDGVSLMQWLQEQQYSKKIIVVSGYTEFHYMQKTIQYGGFDYLPKPVDDEKLTVVLKAAIHALEEEAKEQQKTFENEIRVKEAIPMYWSHLMTELVEHPETYKKAQNKLKEELGISIGSQAMDYTATMVSFVTDAEQIKAKFSGHTELFYFVVINIINEILSLPDQGIAFRFLGKPGRILVLLKKSAHFRDEWRRIYQEIYHYYNIEVEIYLGSSIRGLDGMQTMYNTLEEIYYRRNLLKKDRDGIYTEEDIENTSWRPVMDQDSHVLVILRSGNIVEIERYMDSFFEIYEGSGILQRKNIQSWETELDFLNKNLDDQEVKSAVELKWWNHQGGFSLEAVKLSLSDQLIKTANQLGEQQGQNTVFEVRRYIDEHYANSINIKSLAETFFINPEHLSRIFRQKYHIQIKDYLMEKRITKAKLLLKGQKLKINEIASIVGFNDEKYFSKVFRKSEGMTPKEFKGKSVE